MDLKAKVLKVEIIKNAAFNTRTGDPDPSYFLEATVIDTGVDIPVKYQCSFRESLGVDLLQNAYHDKIPEADRDALAAKVLANAKQHVEQQEITLIVIDIVTNNGYVKLLVKKP